MPAKTGRRGVPVIGTAAVLAVLSIGSASPGAQWLHYPTTGVPRTAAGTPNLEAPTPRTADGKPDFSGLWDIEHNRRCPPDGCADMPVGQEFINIGWSLKGGLPYLPWAAAITKKRTEDLRTADPTSFCLPIGIVRLHTMALLKKIVQVPGLLVILNEHNSTFRQIFTDGRPLPVDPNPSWVGYSSGTWEGDTLVVQSTGFRDGLWLDANGSPMTDAARITERFRRVNYGKLEIDLSVDDAKAYTAPWTVKLNQFIAPDTDLLDYICNENEKDLPHLVGK
ncbi:MAG: hypothetical protein ABJA98_32825 [Acidobacteriota bacterium]